MIYDNIDDFLNLNNDHLICFTVSTYNNLNLIRNLINSSINNEIKLVFFALDKNIANFLNKNFDIDIVLFFIDNSLNNKFFNFKFGSKEWKNMVYDRYFITHRLLKDGRNIVYMDTDIYINRNFILDIKDKLRLNDIVIQANDKNCCTGFYAMKSCKKLINFFNRKNMTNKLNCYDFGGKGGGSDQIFFNHYIGESVDKRKEFNCVLLERNFYPNGNYFYDNHDLISEYCYIIHFNCIRGEFSKIKKVIEFNKLIVDLIDYIPDNQENLEDKDTKEYKKLIKSHNENIKKKQIELNNDEQIEDEDEDIDKNILLNIPISEIMKIDNNS